MGSLFSRHQPEEQEKPKPLTVTTTTTSAALKRSTSSLLSVPTKRLRMDPPSQLAKQQPRQSATCISVTQEKPDREEDIRSTNVRDLPVQKQYLLRAIRSKDHGLTLDLEGKPLYSDTFFTSLAESASVLPPPQPQQNSLNLDPNSQNQQRSRADTYRKHEHQTNFLDYQTQRQLRKKQFNFSGSTETARKWEKVQSQFTQPLSDQIDSHTGSFGLPEKRKIDLRNKLYLAPLTTVGNLPFRRVCKQLGADITCGEMAVDRNLLMGQASEWALVRRHRDEDLFGVQIAGSNVDTITRAAEVVGKVCNIDFLEINAGCPIDLVFNRGGGCGLMRRAPKLRKLVWSVNQVADVPVGVKMRTGISQSSRNAASLINDVAKAGAAWVTIHGRSRKQRYSKLADWEYIKGPCVEAATQIGVPLIGNGDVYNWRDVVRAYDDDDVEGDTSGIETVMVARGALIKPWIFKEIKEKRDWDISSGERLELYKEYAKMGLEHWGCDSRGIETTRKFLLEWLSFLYRYVPIGLIEHGHGLDVSMSDRAPFFRGRNELETLLGSSQCGDWVRITEMLLGKAPVGFKFAPRHKSNAWESVNVNGGEKKRDDATKDWG